MSMLRAKKKVLKSVTVQEPRTKRGMFGSKLSVTGTLNVRPTTTNRQSVKGLIPSLHKYSTLVSWLHVSVFYKTIFRPMLTIGSYIKCVHTGVLISP